MGSGGSGAGGQGSSRGLQGGSYGGSTNAGVPGMSYGGPGNTSGGPVRRPTANTPEMWTTRDANGNTVKHYQTSNAGRMSAVGYREVYSPTGKLISTTKPQAGVTYTPVNPYRPSGGEPH